MSLKLRLSKYLVQSRADVRPHDELDALDLGLDEHDAEVLFF